MPVNGWEFVILVIVGIVVLGPERLPEYAAKLGRLVRQARTMAENARSQLGEELGPEFDDVDWEQFDPRRYDPRRIVREALLDPPEDGDGADGGDDQGASGRTSSRPAAYDPQVATPWDSDAT